MVLHFRCDDELGIFTREDIARDQSLLAFYRVPKSRVDERSLRFEQALYVRSAADLHCLIRHACRPTAYVDWNEFSFRALRDLKDGDEITLNYLTMYDAVESPFICHCGVEECYGMVRGFRYLSLDEQVKLELYLSPFLRGLLNEHVLSSRAQAS